MDGNLLASHLKLPNSIAEEMQFDCSCDLMKSLLIFMCLSKNKIKHKMETHGLVVVLWLVIVY